MRALLARAHAQRVQVPAPQANCGLRAQQPLGRDHVDVARTGDQVDRFADPLPGRVARAVSAFPHAEAIFQTNIDTMERIGVQGWDALGVAASPQDKTTQ